jgi:hypothetical protein
MSRDRLIELT